MSRPKKQRPVSQFEISMNEFRADAEMSAAEKKRFFSGETLMSIYNKENNIDINNLSPEQTKLGIGKDKFDLKQIGWAPDGTFDPTNLTRDFNKAAEIQNYFVKAYDQYKKDRLVKKEKIKLLTEQPGLSAQTRGQSALSLTGGATINALTPPAGSSSKSGGYGK